MRLPLQLPDFSSVGAGQRATLDIPLGLGIHDISLNLKDEGTDMTVAQMKARVTEIVLKSNGKPIREWTPTTLDVVNSSYGSQYAAADGWLRDYFSEPWTRTMEGEERGALGTGGLQSLTLEVKFNGDAVDPTVVAYANFEETNRAFNQFPFRHIRMLTGQAVVNGRTQISNPLKEVGLFYRRLHFLSAAITSVDIRVNKVTKWDNLPRALVSELMSKSGFALQANTYTVAFDMSSRQLTDQLPTFVKNDAGQLANIADFRIEYTGNAAGSVDVLHELYQIIR